MVGTYYKTFYNLVLHKPSKVKRYTTGDYSSMPGFKNLYTNDAKRKPQ